MFGFFRVNMEPMDIVGKNKEDASLPKGYFLLFSLNSMFYFVFASLRLD